MKYSVGRRNDPFSPANHDSINSVAHDRLRLWVKGGHRVHQLSISVVPQDRRRSFRVAETFRKVPDFDVQNGIVTLE
jgi:hypothetical protein